MKKVYKKPMIYIEKFSVDKNFAHLCTDAEYGDFQNQYTCEYMGFFYSHCGDGLSEGNLEEWCYNGGSFNSSIFAS